MSQFPGWFGSIPGISCDQFAGRNLLSDQFFLSHCHADHMIGLEALSYQLKRKNIVRVNHRIYCSMISKTFIVKKFPGLDERFVKDLFPNEPIVIDVFDKAKSAMYKLRVTGIPANHCPGSMMFLFEALDDRGNVGRRILYTGDFRFENIPLPSLTSLHDSDGQPIRLDEMYLDTTFCSPQYTNFPSRDQALKCIWDLVHSWIRKNGMYRNQRAKHVVLFHLPAQYGSEAILRDIYEKSGAKWRIHVSQKKFQEYLCTDDLGDCTDSDFTSAQWIHACSWREEKTRKSKEYFIREIPCQDGPFEVCQIRPSAMYFRKERLNELEDKVVKCIGGQSYRVCYSCHSSMTELLDFVKHFQPRKVVPTVIPPGGTTMAEMQEILESVLVHHPDEVRIPEEPSVLESYVPAGRSPELDSQLLFLDNLKSPPAGRKRNRSPVCSNSRKRLLLDDRTGSADSDRRITFEEDTSDEEIPPESPTARARTKRKVFHRSRTKTSACSMPVKCSNSAPSKNRRASLPHNLKIPAITITPSSPSPDPNHPDYPEFFEDKLYLDTKNSMSTSTESGGEPPGKEEEMVIDDPKDLEEVFLKESSSLEICYESVLNKKSCQSGDLLDEVEDMESTPELDVVLASAQTTPEKQNCINFAERRAKETTRRGIDFKE